MWIKFKNIIGLEMKKTIKRYKPLFESNFDLLTEMSNISKQKTGLDYIVWLFPNTGKEKHGARIKIKVDNEYVPITISDEPEVKSFVKIDSKKLNKIKNWIILNKEILLKYWNGKGEVAIDEILDKLKEV